MQPGDMITFMTNGADAIVVDVRGFNIQAALDMSAPEFRTVHMDAVMPMVPTWSDVDDTTFVNMAINAMAERSLPLGIFTLARYGLRMRAAYIAEKTRADGTETALTGEGEALDQVAGEREELRRDLDACKEALGKHANGAIPTSASIGLLVETLESRTISLSEHIREHDAVVRELDQARADLATLNRAHEEALRERDTMRNTILDIHDALAAMPIDPTRLPNSGSKIDTVQTITALIRERDEAMELAHNIGRDRRECAHLLDDSIMKANVPGFVVYREPQCHVTLDDAVAVAVNAISEFGVLNCEMQSVNAVLKGIVKPGESVSATVKRVVATLAERDAELAKWSGHECEKTGLAKALEILEARRTGSDHVHELGSCTFCDSAEAIVDNDPLGIGEDVQELRLSNMMSKLDARPENGEPCAYPIAIPCNSDDVPAFIKAMNARDAANHAAGKYYVATPVDVGALPCDCAIMADSARPYAHCLAAMNEDVHVPDPSVDAVLAEHSNGPDSGAIAATGANAWVAQKIEQQYEQAEKIFDPGIDDLRKPFDAIADAARQARDDMERAAFQLAAHAQLAEPVTLSPIAKRVLDYLTAEQEPRNAHTICRVVGLGTIDWKRARRELDETHLLIVSGEGRGTTYQARQ